MRTPPQANGQQDAGRLEVFFQYSLSETLDFRQSLKSFHEEPSLGSDGTLQFHPCLLGRSSSLEHVALTAAGYEVAPGAGAALTTGNDMIHGGCPPGAPDVLTPVAIAPENAGGSPTEAQFRLGDGFNPREDHSVEGLGINLLEAKLRPGPQVKGMRPPSGESLQGLPAGHLHHRHVVAVEGENCLESVIFGMSGHGKPHWCGRWESNPQELQV